GQMSEKHLPVDPAQLSLFSTEHISEEQKAEADEANVKADLVGIANSTRAFMIGPCKKSTLKNAFPFII
ncbi:MAG: hypothetical protein II213_05280, partial [Lachnospiraceae bacterium]|nr:hypothetical protein [Lachnospiraceae bacterium]